MTAVASISAVMPVFNAERYLPAALDSLVSQGEALSQIIVVNDGSTDSTAGILARYAEQDKRVQVLHKRNEGAGKARRDGVALSSSSYTLFVDSDDRLVERAVELIAIELSKHGPDLLQFGYITGPEANEKTHLPECVHCGRDAFRKEHIDRLLNTPDRLVVLWDKVYKTDLLRAGVSDWGNQVFEDYLINVQYFRHVSRFKAIPEALYRYRTCNKSLSRTFNRSAFDDLLHVHRAKCEFLKEMGLDSEHDRERNAQWLQHFRHNISLAMFSYANTLSWDDKRRELRRIWRHPATQGICAKSNDPMGHDIDFGNVDRFMIKLMAKAWGIRCKRLIKRILAR